MFVLKLHLVLKRAKPDDLEGSGILITIPLIECLASNAELANFREAVELALHWLGICADILEKRIDTDPVISPIADSASVIADCATERSARIRLVSGCRDIEGNPIMHPAVNGLDFRAGPTWRTTAFFSSTNAKDVFEIRRALTRLLLDPLYSGAIREDKTRDEFYKESPVYDQIFRDRLDYLLLSTDNHEHGRILWIDANPTVDTIIDPYGLSILSEIARTCGFLSIISSPFTEFAEPTDGLKALVNYFKPDLIGISLRNIDDAVPIRTTDGEAYSIDTINYVPQVQTLISCVQLVHAGHIILGGAALTRAPNFLLQVLGIRYGVQGPADDIIYSLLTKWRPNRQDALINESFETLWSQIPRTIDTAVHHEHTISNTLSQSLANLRSTHVPRNPVRLWFENRLRIGTAVRGTYGCPLDCGYCLEATPGLRMTRGSAAATVDEMEWLLARYNVNHFHLTDSEANLPFSRLTELGHEITSRGLNQQITWAVYATPHPFPINAVESLFEAGLRTIKLSIDHFEPEQLQRLGKVHTAKAIHTLLSELGRVALPIQVSASILFGAPGETIQSIDRTIEHMKEYANEGIIFYYNVGLRLYPGTPLFREWHDGRLDQSYCYGPGLKDSGLSPLIYCSPGAPRLLARKIADACRVYSNISQIAAYRPESSDEALRLLYVAISMWFRGQKQSAHEIMKRIDPNTLDEENYLAIMTECEQQLRYRRTT